MTVNRRVVKRRTACWTIEDWLEVERRGRVVGPYFTARDGRSTPGFVAQTVLCWWCRERHSPDEVEACMALPRKTASTGDSGSSTSSVLVAGPLSQSPELWAFLTAISFPDGTKRRTGRLSVSFESGMLGLLLSDEETGQYAFLNGRNLDDLIAEAELRLADGSLSFRPSRFNGRKK